MELSIGVLTVSLYFLSLFGVFCVVVADLAKNARANLRSVLLGLCSFSAFVCTWYHIAMWLKGDMAKPEYQGQDFWYWIRESDLFVDAYKQVADGPVRWYWSAQLLSFVMPWVLFVAVANARKGVNIVVTVCYIWLGFAGAISLALPLHLIRCGDNGYHQLLVGSKEGQPTASHGLKLALAISGISIVSLPVLKEAGLFWVPLAALHIALLCFPFCVRRRDPPPAYSPLFYALAVFCTATHAHNLYLAYPTLATDPSLMWSEIWSNHCQASITFDAFFVSTVSFGSILLSKNSRPGFFPSFLLTLGSLVVSPGATLAVWMGLASGY
eukprot:TRINITY_DN8225_c0_g2_i2.p1 TRINITY_DN8225_c0_g2~~TRINITY_DN8225_c0_g2_i2.p1  ORF type:complete len:326 (+),score=37.05 TRINITY_DN8225_c0_g2_i2:190-1167(+)